MSKLMVIFNHTLTEAQREDAVAGLGISEIVLPSGELSDFWASIPPEPESIADQLDIFYRWLTDSGVPGDYVLSQGGFGATVLLVKYALNIGLKPVYSTTRRKAFEEVLVNNEVKVSHCFKHVRFRLYEV